MIAKIYAAIALCASAGLCFAADSQKAVSVAGVTLNSVEVTFPQSDRLFPGENADAINSNCLTCHSASMIFNQPQLSKAAWEEEVTKMRKAYGAPVPDESVSAIVDYLAGLRPTD